MQIESIFKAFICIIIHKIVCKRCLGRINKVRKWMVMVRKQMIRTSVFEISVWLLKANLSGYYFTHIHMLI